MSKKEPKSLEERLEIAEEQAEKNKKRLINLKFEKFESDNKSLRTSNDNLKSVNDNLNVKHSKVLNQIASLIKEFSDESNTALIGNEDSDNSWRALPQITVINKLNEILKYDKDN